MAIEHRAKLDLALRRNQGRHLLDEYVSTASERLGRPVDGDSLLDLSTTDKIAHAAEARLDELLSPGERTIECYMGIDTLDRGIATAFAYECITGLLAEHPLFLLAQGSYVCGAIPVTSSEMATKALHFSRDDGPPVIASYRAVVGMRFYSDDFGGHERERWELLGWRVAAPAASNEGSRG